MFHFQTRKTDYKVYMEKYTFKNKEKIESDYVKITLSNNQISKYDKILVFKIPSSSSRTRRSNRMKEKV